MDQTYPAPDAPARVSCYLSCGPVVTTTAPARDLPAATGLPVTGGDVVTTACLGLFLVVCGAALRFSGRTR